MNLLLTVTRLSSCS